MDDVDGMDDMEDDEKDYVRENDKKKNHIILQEARTKFSFLACTTSSSNRYTGSYSNDNNNKTSINHLTNHHPEKMKKNLTNHIFESIASKGCSLLFCEPYTGRTHQIRRHAIMLGHPILGDTQHGDTKVNALVETSVSFATFSLALSLY